jgi:hypothetical protein
MSCRRANTKKKNGVQMIQWQTWVTEQAASPLVYEQQILHRHLQYLVGLMLA